MRKLLAIASILAMSTGAAMAQTTPSTTDKPAAAGAGGETKDQKQSSPGSTGAMQNEVGGTATSSQDVQKQGGMGVGSEGDSGKAGKTMGGGGGEKPK